jgi:hypothetical protein
MGRIEYSAPYDPMNRLCALIFINRTAPLGVAKIEDILPTAMSLSPLYSQFAMRTTLGGGPERRLTQGLTAAAPRLLISVRNQQDSRAEADARLGGVDKFVDA